MDVLSFSFKHYQKMTAANDDAAISVLLLSKRVTDNNSTRSQLASFSTF
jgi:hypothetical protein